MAINTIRSFVILRNDTANNWSLSSVILKAGELALSLDNGVYSVKVGDGVNTWKNLPFINVNISDVKGLEAQLNAKADKNLVDQIKTIVETLGTLAFKDKIELGDVNADDISAGKVNVSRLNNDEILILNCGSSQNS